MRCRTLRHQSVFTQPRPTADVVTERLHASVRYIYRAAMPRLKLFPFRYRNPVTGKWVRTRYVATREEIAKANFEWEFIEPPEIRDVHPHARYFTPFRVTLHAEAMRMFEPAPQINPHLERPPAIDAMECFLTTLFLRRYVTYCARRRRYAPMQGAARLLSEIAAGA